MDDESIITLYFERSELAVEATSQKFGAYCGSIATSILACREDAEECVNDTWLHAWNAIPPHRPPRLSAFLGKITRELSINRWKMLGAQKRGGGEIALAYEEIDELVAGNAACVDERLGLEELGAAISEFLRAQPEETADIFVRRYHHFRSIKQLCEEFSMGESRVKSTLARMRKKLLEALRERELV